MTEKYFLIDTNVLVYSLDTTHISKHTIAKNLIKNLLLKEEGFVLAAQNLAELYNVLRYKSEKKASAKEVKEIMRDINAIHKIKKINYTHISVQHAAEIAEKQSVHFWDVLIATTMLENGITHLYTENVKDFSKIQGIVAVNPFEN